MIPLRFNPPERLTLTLVSGPAGFQPPFDPPDGDDISEVHLSNLQESPSGDPSRVELQTTQDLTGGLEEGCSSPSKKEHLRKREAADSGYLSDHTGGVSTNKRAGPLENWEEPHTPTTGVLEEQPSACLPERAEPEMEVSEGACPDLTEQKAEPESYLTSDITAAFKSFRAQLEQRFTGCWQKVEAEVLTSLKDCQQHVSSLLTAVHQHRLSLLQHFENSVTDQLKHLEENSTNLNSISAQILTFFHSEMENLGSFCQEHLQKLKTLDPDQQRTAGPSNL